MKLKLFTTAFFSLSLFCISNTFGQQKIKVVHCQIAGKIIVQLRESSEKDYQWVIGTDTFRTPNDFIELDTTYLGKTIEASWYCTCCNCWKKRTTYLQPRQKPELPIRLSTADASCNGLFDGTATVASDGKAFWSDGATEKRRTNLGAGTYSITVTAADGCEQRASVLIRQPKPAAVAQAAIEPTHCHQTPTGNIRLSMVGGNAPYQFKWSNNPSRTDSANLQLLAGAYSVTVSSREACSFYDYTVPDVAPITLETKSLSNYNGFHLRCPNANDGYAVLQIRNGKPPYAVQWNGGAAEAAAPDFAFKMENLTASPYAVTVTDAAGCRQTTTVQLNAPAPLVVRALAYEYQGGFHLPCFGSAGGSISATATGGAGNYSFQWMRDDTLLSNRTSIANLSAATYYVRATDANGCISKPTRVTLRSPARLQLVVKQTSAKKKHITAKGGTGSYQVALRTSNLSKLQAGSPLETALHWKPNHQNTFATAYGKRYELSITDENGCSVERVFCVQKPLSTQALPRKRSPPDALFCRRNIAKKSKTKCPRFQ